MLARSPAASNNITVYNDFLRLEEDLQTRGGSSITSGQQAEESKPVPKTKKHYKQIREREERRADLPGRQSRSAPAGLAFGAW